MAPTFWAEVMGLSPFLIVLLFVEIALMSATSFWSARQRFEYRYRALVFVTIATNVFSLGAGIIAILNTDAKVEARVIMDVIAKGIPGILLMVLIFARGKCLFVFNMQEDGNIAKACDGQKIGTTISGGK